MSSSTSACAASSSSSAIPTSQSANLYTHLPTFLRDTSKYSVPNQVPSSGYGYGYQWRAQQEFEADYLKSLSTESWQAICHYYEEWLNFGHQKVEFPLNLSGLTAAQLKGVRDCLGNTFPLFTFTFLHKLTQADGKQDSEIREFPNVFVPYMWLQEETTPVALTWVHILGIQLFGSRETHNSFSFACTPSGVILGTLSGETMKHLVHREGGLRDLEDHRDTYKVFLSLPKEVSPIWNIKGDIDKDGIFIHWKPSLEELSTFFCFLVFSHERHQIGTWFAFGRDCMLPEDFDESSSNNTSSTSQHCHRAAKTQGKTGTVTESKANVVKKTKRKQKTTTPLGSSKADAAIEQSTTRMAQVQTSTNDAPKMSAEKRGKQKANTPNEPARNDSLHLPAQNSVSGNTPVLTTSFASVQLQAPAPTELNSRISEKRRGKQKVTTLPEFIEGSSGQSSGQASGSTSDAIFVNFSAADAEHVLAKKRGKRKAETPAERIGDENIELTGQASSSSSVPREIAHPRKRGKIDWPLRTL